MGDRESTPRPSPRPCATLLPSHIATALRRPSPPITCRLRSGGFGKNAKGCRIPPRELQENQLQLNLPRRNQFAVDNPAVVSDLRNQARCST